MTRMNRVLVVLAIALMAIPSAGYTLAEHTGSGLTSVTPDHPSTKNLVKLYAFNTSDNRTYPSRGVTTQVTAFSMPPYRGNGTASVELTSGVSVDGNLIVAGLEANITYTGEGVYAFAAEINLTSGSSDRFELGSAVPTGSLVTLSVVLTGSSTWSAMVNGTSLLNVTIPGGGPLTSAAQILLDVVLSSNDTPWLPVDIYLPHAIEVLNPATGWITPDQEYVFAAGQYPTYSLPPLNVSSQSTDSTLAPGEIHLGTGVRSSDNGLNPTQLWNGVPSVAVDLAGSISPGFVTAGHSVNASWRAIVAGGPIRGLRIEVWSSAGGNVTELYTNSKGYANTTYSTPVVKRQTVVYLNATILDSTDYGSGSAAVVLLPLLHLTVGVSARAITSGKVNMVELVVLVENSGVPLAGAELYPSASVGGGAFAPIGPWVTDGSGYAYANYTPPSFHGNITLSIDATYSGYSASGSVLVVVMNADHNTSPPSSSQPLWLYGAIGAGLAVVIAIAMVGLARRSMTPPKELGPDPGAPGETEPQDETPKTH